jgi:TRAP-type mannitol/chloroaromatic compound transport system permease large subunit
MGTIKYILPMGFIVFMVLGLIILGMATPSEAAASGTIATLMVVILYGRFTWDVMLKSLQGTITIAVMVLTIIAASKTFSNILAFSGATQGLLDVIQQLKVHPLVILISMQILVFF